MNTILEQINSAGYVFVEFALPMLAQSSVLIVVLLLADLLLRKKVRAVFRYWLWMLVLLKLILPTTLSSPVSLGSWFGDELANIKVSDTSIIAQPVNLTQITETETVAEADTPPAVTLMPGVEPIVTPTAGTEQVVAEVVALPLVSPTPVTWRGIVFLVWAAGVVAMSLLLLQRAIFVRGLVVDAKNPTQLMNDTFQFCCRQMGLKGKVGLKVSAKTASPAVCGLFRPVILLPQNLAPALGSSRLRPVLLHELAHIKRGDLWINLAQTILQIIYFYNPLLWLANSIIRRIREQAVDEAVQVAMGAKAKQYPQTLVDVAKMAFSRPALSLRLIGVVESKSALKGRIKRMLNRPIPKTAKLGILGLIVLLIFAAVLLPMAKAQEKQQTTNEYSFVTVKEGVGFDDIIVGDVNCTGEFIKSKLGEPDKEVKNEKDWWLNYRKSTGLGFWVNPRENVLIEMRLNKKFKGELTSGISMSSTKQDVFDVYGQPIREEVAEDFDQRFDNQVLLFRESSWMDWIKRRNIAKIYYDEHGLLFWFDDDTINQIVVYRPVAVNEGKKRERPDIHEKKTEIIEKLVVLTEHRDRVQRDLDSAERALAEVRERWDFSDLEERDYPHPVTERLNRLQREKDDLVLEISQLQANIINLREKGDKSNLIKAQERLAELQAKLDTLEKMRAEADARKRELDLARIQYKQRAVIRDERLQRINELKSQIEKFRLMYENPEVFDVEGEVEAEATIPQDTLDLLPNIFIMEPSQHTFSIFNEVVSLTQDWVWNKTGRLHSKKSYDEIFDGTHNRTTDDILVLVFSLDRKDRIPAEYEDLLPKTWPEIEAELKQGKTVELLGKARGLNAILIAAPEMDKLKKTISKSKFLNNPKSFIKTSGKDCDVGIEDFKINFESDRMVYNLIASIHNYGKVASPKFIVKFYRGDSDWVKPMIHGAGPIEPGGVWNERSLPFALKDGVNEILVILDPANLVEETDETNNRALIKVVVEDDRIIEKSVSYSPLPKAERSEPKTDVQVDVEEPGKVSHADKMASENLVAQGWALLLKQKLAEAEKAFEQAVEKYPNNANAWNGLGWSQQNQGKPLNAKTSFEKCLEIQPKHDAALNGLGWIAKAQGKTDEAIGHWGKAVEATPTATAALNGLATTYMELKQFDKAVKYYNMWLKVEPDNADAKAGLQKAKSAKTNLQLEAEGTRSKELERIVEKAVTVISTCAESDPLVKQSLESLQGLDEQAVVEKVVKFLDSDKNTVRRSAIYILWNGNFEGIAPAVPYLQNLCSHEEEYTRGMAALALGEKKAKPAFDTLCNMTLNDSSAYARRCAAYALGLMGNPEAKEVLEKALKDLDFNVRNNAEAALTMLSQVEKTETEVK